MKKRTRYSPEIREPAVRMVFEHERDHHSPWAIIQSIARKIGCMPETLRKRVRQLEKDEDRRAVMTSDERAWIKELERENRQLCRANKILRKVSVYFAQAELGRPRK